MERCNIFIVIIIIFFLALPLQPQLTGGLLINEIACGTSGKDWVEIFFCSAKKEKIDVSSLYVSMFYGKPEPLSVDPVFIYSYDRLDTPYDDRFIVVNFNSSSGNDETCFTGDTNNNGNIDLYCHYYSGSLWNSDCVVAIHSVGEPSDWGIIDFVAYSNRDGEINPSIGTYVVSAELVTHWCKCLRSNIQECMVNIGRNGLASYESIVRIGPSDHNSQDDFEITKYQTPGMVNITGGSIYSKGKLFSASKKRITMIPSHPLLGTGDIEIFIYDTCNIRFRVFSSIGRLIFESSLLRDLNPGKFLLNWNLRGLKRRACTGLYIGYIEAISRKLKKRETERIYIILSQHK